MSYVPVQSGMHLVALMLFLVVGSIAGSAGIQPIAAAQERPIPTAIPVTLPGEDDATPSTSGRIAELIPEAIVFPAPTFGASWHVEITNVEVVPTIQDTLLDELEVADGQYWVVLMTVTNLTDIAADFTDSLLYAHDASGATHRHDILAGSAYRFGDEVLYDALPDPRPRNGWMPGVPYDYAIVFDVPAEVTAITVQSEDATFAARLGETAPIPEPAIPEPSMQLIAGTLVLRQDFTGEFLNQCWGFADPASDVDLTGIGEGTSVSVHGPDGRLLGTDNLSNASLLLADPISAGYWCHLIFVVRVELADSYFIQVDGLTPVTIDRKTLEMTDWHVEIAAG